MVDLDEEVEVLEGEVVGLMGSSSSGTIKIWQCYFEVK